MSRQPGRGLAGFRARTLAFYLPQYYPTPENDDWWGPGFTEWTNVAAARPLYRGHDQPNLPGELGFYDLRLRATREEQAALAMEHGIEAFCYWHYWFGGRRILNEVFDDVLASGSPQHGFALAWANVSWTGVWHGNPGRVLIEQTYPGEADHRAHFDYLLDAFRDPRYFRVEGKPLFYIFAPEAIPNVGHVTSLWRKLAADAGLPGLYLVAQTFRGPLSQKRLRRTGMDAFANIRFPWAGRGTGVRVLRRRARAMRKGARFSWGRGPARWPITVVHPPRAYVVAKRSDVHPVIFPNWDNTPRSGRGGVVLSGSSPEQYARHLSHAADAVAAKPLEHRLVFIKSWNEWAEGNYLEPDRQHGRKWLEATRDALASPD